jgi:hypothetical protein
VSSYFKLWRALRLGPTTAIAGARHDRERLRGHAAKQWQLAIKVPAAVIVCVALLCGSASAAGATEEDVPARERFVRELQQALRGNDKTWLADHVRYPLRYYGRKDSLIRDRSAFMRRYSSIFSDRLKSIVLAQDPSSLFENWQGIMIGNGQIWIRGSADHPHERFRIITINDFE